MKGREGSFADDNYRRRRRRATEGSLGYGLVRSLVKQIGVVLTVDGSDGVSVIISFPDPLAVDAKGPWPIA